MNFSLLSAKEAHECHCGKTVLAMGSHQRSAGLVSHCGAVIRRAESIGATGMPAWFVGGT